MHIDRIAQVFRRAFHKMHLSALWANGGTARAARRLLRESGQVNIGHYRSLGIQARLMMLAFVTALPLVVLAGVTAISFIDAQDVQLKHEVAGKVNALRNDIDRQISAIQVELEVLSKL